MGLLSEAARTYDVLKEYVGKFEDNKEPLAPLYHKKELIKISALLTKDGKCDGIQRIEEVGIIPSSEEAQGRSGSKIAPYPLMDNIKNLVAEENRKVFLSNLKKWLDFSPNSIELQAVYRYLSKGTIEADLKEFGIKDEDYSLFLGWVVEADENNIKTWKDPNLIFSYINFCQNNNVNKGKVLSMISGKKDVPINNIPSIPVFVKAKLISGNDDKNFTYRGRFKDKNEALTLGYSDTIKAINVLSWLCANQSVLIGGDNRLICWSPDGIENVPNLLFSLMGNEQEKHITYSNYKQAIEKYIQGLCVKPDFISKKVVTTILGKATPGRISTKFYSELSYSSFLGNIAKWDQECCWFDSYSKSVKSPSIRDIAKYSTGIGEDFRTEKNASYHLAYENLIERKVCGGSIPINIKSNLVNRCANLKVYMNKIGVVNDLLFVTCSVIRKYYFKEKEYSMDLNKDLLDRSYQYGRLLAILEKIEVDALSNTDSKRIPNAIQLQSMFVRRPGTTTKILLEKLKTGYYSRLMSSKPGLLVYYEQLIGEIMEILSKMPIEDYDRPLGETYVLGYYLQKNEFYTKKSNEEK